MAGRAGRPQGIEQYSPDWRSGRGQMPAVGKNWTDHQIDALVAYNKTLAKGGAG